MKRLIYNAIRTPDGTILTSRNRHDFKEYTDANGKTYMVDGGLEYIRRYVVTPDAEELSVHLEDGIEHYRNFVEWGTYGKTGTEPLHFVKLCNMSNAHIEAILNDNLRIHPNLKQAFENELEYRKRTCLIIED